MARKSLWLIYTFNSFISRIIQYEFTDMEDQQYVVILYSNTIEVA